MNKRIREIKNLVRGLEEYYGTKDIYISVIRYARCRNY